MSDNAGLAKILEREDGYLSEHAEFDITHEQYDGETNMVEITIDCFAFELEYSLYLDDAERFLQEFQTAYVNAKHAENGKEVSA